MICWGGKVKIVPHCWEGVVLAQRHLRRFDGFALVEAGGVELQ